MKNSFLEESSSILSTKMARVDLDETTPKFNSSTEEEVIITPSVQGKTYRLTLNSGPLFCCSNTGIKFKVNFSATIEYELEYGSAYMNQIKDNGYELVGPLFNIRVAPGVVSSVHLPHYLHMEDLGGEKSSIKYGHIKDDGKIHFLKPTRIESSYVVLDNPSFSRAGVMFRMSSFLFSRKKSIPIYSKVLLYFCVKSPHKEEIKEYRTHLYLVPCMQVELSKLDDMKEKSGFKLLDKPPFTTLFSGNTYTVDVTWPPERKINPKDLLFRTNVNTQDLPYTEINVKGSATSILLELRATGVQDPLWHIELTSADLEDESLMTMQSNKPGQPGNHFVIKYRQELIQKINPIGPVLDTLLSAKQLLSKEQYDIVHNTKPSCEQMRELYNYVICWGERDMDVFYDVLKKHYPKIIKDLQRKN